MSAAVRVALIDYRAGNLTSVRKALTAVGAEVSTPERPADLASAQALVVPGVGHFDATRVLDDTWRDAIRGFIAASGPVLGICLGMQWLYQGSAELPGAPGLGVFDGECFRLPSNPAPASGEPAATVKVPHVGWNALAIQRSDRILEGVANQAQVYFTHSYAAPLTADTVAATTHGTPFASVVQRGSVAGVQFHPEKSGPVGLQILRNFLAMGRS